MILEIKDANIASDLGDKLFIDPANLVDRLVDSNRYEGYSFNGTRTYRDIIIVFFISLVLLSTIMMLIRKKKIS